jgi:hypothetical protein
VRKRLHTTVAEGLGNNSQPFGELPFKSQSNKRLPAPLSGMLSRVIWLLKSP